MTSMVIGDSIAVFQLGHDFSVMETAIDADTAWHPRYKFQFGHDFSVMETQHGCDLMRSSISFQFGHDFSVMETT